MVIINILLCITYCTYTTYVYMSKQYIGRTHNIISMVNLKNAFTIAADMHFVARRLFKPDLANVQFIIFSQLFIEIY